MYPVENQNIPNSPSVPSNISPGLQGVDFDGSLVAFRDFDLFRNIAEDDSLKTVLIGKRTESRKPQIAINNRKEEQNEIPEGFLEYILDENNSVIIGDYLNVNSQTINCIF